MEPVPAIQRQPKARSGKRHLGVCDILAGRLSAIFWMTGSLIVVVLAAQSDALRWQLFALNAKVADLGERLARIEQAVIAGLNVPRSGPR